jgi:hypothetical protein
MTLQRTALVLQVACFQTTTYARYNMQSRVLINAQTEQVAGDHHWPLREMSRATPPSWVSHRKPAALDLQKGSSNPSTLLQPSGLKTHSNLNPCAGRTPWSRFPHRRIRQHSPTGFDPLFILERHIFTTTCGQRFYKLPQPLRSGSIELEEANQSAVFGADG